MLAARREHFDAEATTWDIPAENSKNGAPIRHKLPKQTQTIVKKFLIFAGTKEWLMPSSRGLGRKALSVEKICADGSVVNLKAVGA